MYYRSGEESKAGDIVECVHCDGIHVLANTNRYQVTDFDGRYVRIQGVTGCLCPTRFKLISRQEEPLHAPENRTKFWMVLGRGTPAYRHLTKKAAATEAERLARACPGEEFTVLEAVAAVKQSGLAWSSCGESQPSDDEVPF